jgi:DNA-binding NarL/FixJ family response regulator
MLKILIADDHEIVRRGLRAQLNQHRGWTVCSEARNGREAVQMAIATQPNVVIMDISMPELNGLEATRQIRRLLPQTHVLVFTMHESERMIREAISAGARGYVLKQDAESHLIFAVESLASHRSYFTSYASDTLLNDYLRLSAAGEESPGFGLSNREREIIQMLAEGKSNKEIANQLCISAKTVETHRATVMRKLELTSIVGLVHYAIRNQLVEA